VSSTAFAAFPNRNPFVALYHDSNNFNPLTDVSGADRNKARCPFAFQGTPLKPLYACSLKEPVETRAEFKRAVLQGRAPEEIRPAQERLTEHQNHLHHLARMLPPDHGIPVRGG
jgi:hypothetical protein